MLWLNLPIVAKNKALAISVNLALIPSVKKDMGMLIKHKCINMMSAKTQKRGSDRLHV